MGPRFRRWVVIGCSIVAACQALPGQAPRWREVHRQLPGPRTAGPFVMRGDLDLDGVQDLLTVDFEYGALARSSIWRGVATGGYRIVPNALPLTQGAPSAAHLFDADGDGDLDCVVAIRPVPQPGTPVLGGGSLRLFLNSGNGTFSPTAAAVASTATDVVLAMASGDVDGDGDLDLVLGTTPQTNFQPGGSFGSWTDFGGQDRLLLNSQGVFTQATFPNIQSAARARHLADFDGDGDLDLFASNAGEAGFYTYADMYFANDGTGNFIRVATAIGTDYRYNKNSHTADFDRDGDIDVVSFDMDGTRIWWNDGQAGFVQGAATVAGLPTWITDLHVGDWDGDGWVDVMGVQGETVYVARNVAGSFPSFQVTQTSPWSNYVTYGQTCLVDFEGDADLDLLQLPNDNTEASLLRNVRGSWQAIPIDVPQTGVLPVVFDIADVDGDGLPDFVGGSSWSNLFGGCLWTNDGAGGLEVADAGALGTWVMTTRDIRAFDFDGDGVREVVTANDLSQLYRSIGGALHRDHAFPQIFARGIAIGDLDGDGDADMFGASDGADHVLLNNGSGMFQAVPVSGATAASRISCIDLDGDGDLDVAAPGRLLRNDGTGAFTPWPGQPPAGNQLVAADFDGDGDVDLVIGDSVTAVPLLMLMNDGGGNFSPASTVLPNDSLRTFSFATADVDGDGDVDLIQCSGAESRLIVNDGIGNLAVVPGAFDDLASNISVVKCVDMDVDGDVDVVFGGATSPRIYRNLAHQLAWSVLPRVGRTLQLDLWGAAGESHVLAFALARSFVPIPGLGVLQLDPATTQVLAVGAYGSSGSAAFQTAVPNHPTLIGLDLYFQVLSLGPPRLGNLERVTLLAD